MPEARFEPQTFGKYLLTDRIGAGGMAEIFRATAFGVEGFTKEVCIKRILPTLTSDETFVKMFIDEAKIAVTLHHANVVQVFDLGRIGEHYFIAMELVLGRDLLQIINRCRASKMRIPVPLTLAIMAEVCKGLDYAHRVKVEGRPLGLIHRDVSPSNILVSWDGEVKVADFGIAKAQAIKDEKTATGTMKGKYGYMSPEQVKGEHVDQRSDIFAAGILLYESLVGARLFKGETDLETLERVRAAVVSPPPSEVNKKVSAEVERIVLKALALDPEARYQTAGALHDALADRLFSMGKRIDSKVLSAFMRKLFADEIREEEERDRERRLLPTPMPQAFIASGESLASSTPPPGYGPPTRRDLPQGAVLLPRPQTSSLVIATWVIGILLLVAAGVVLAFWLASEHPTAVAEPPAVPPPPPPVALKLGTLSITSTPPGAQVELDGQAIGQKTPATIGDLDRTRPHLLGLALEEYEPWAKTVQFGETEMVAIEARLEPLPKPPPPPLPPVRQVFGTLNINAVPVWAYVTINDKKLDQPTPIYNLKLKPGIYTVRLENPKLGLIKTEQVTMKKDQIVDLVVKMK